MDNNPGIEALETALLTFLADYRRAYARLQQYPSRVGLTNAQFALLETVAIHGTGGVSAIAAAAGLTQPSTTRALARLHTKGLLERQKTPRDARITAVAVTPQGAELLTQHRRRLRNAAQTLHDALPAASRKHAVPLLSSLGEALDELL